MYIHLGLCFQKSCFKLIGHSIDELFSVEIMISRDPVQIFKEESMRMKTPLTKSNKKNNEKNETGWLTWIHV